MAMGNLPPIEEPQAYGGFFPALWQTWVSACLRPYEFFEAVGNSQDLTPALLFGVGCGWLGIFFGSLWGVALKVPLLCSGLFGWLFVLLGILLNGLILHLFLALFGGANQGLTITLRVVAYAQAPTILAVVPILGSCVGSIWVLVLHIIGLAAAHRTEVWRAVLAVFAPLLLCLVVSIAIGIFLGFLAASALR
ncbi:MAG: hypothetical protein LKKZDAJK_002121 [Candidatus Fervidibacter sp.]